jgi:hypothetical protein
MGEHREHQYEQQGYNSDAIAAVHGFVSGADRQGAATRNPN